MIGSAAHDFFTMKHFFLENQFRRNYTDIYTLLEKAREEGILNNSFERLVTFVA